MWAITLRAELVALIASSTNPSPNWPSCTIATRTPIHWSCAVWMLAVFVVMASMHLVVWMDVNMLKLLKAVLRIVGQIVEPRMHVI